MIRAFFASQTLEAITYEIMVDCIKMEKSKVWYNSIGATNLTKDILPNRIASYKRFWNPIVKVEIEQQDVKLNKYFNYLHPR